MDDPDWAWRNAPILEHVVHEYHILAALTEIAKEYKNMPKRVSPKWRKLCECLALEDGQIIQFLEALDTLLQG